jgi:hypothetical protein
MHGARHILASNRGSKGHTPLVGGAGVAAHPAARRAGDRHPRSLALDTFIRTPVRIKHRLKSIQWYNSHPRI